jgi:O-antigen/teichoic acid export membrane protein
MLVIAAVLSPQEYGLIILSAVVITGVEVINELGIWQSVVHRRDPDDSFLSTAFAINVFGALVTFTGLFLIAPYVARFYGEPEMTGVLRIMGLALIPAALSFVSDGLLRKELRFKSRALPEIVGALVGVTTTVVLLLFGAGVSSYAVGFVAHAATHGALLIIIAGWRPKAQLSWNAVKEIVPYAKDIVGGDLAKHISSNIDFFIVGRLLGAGPLGFYTLAFNLANYPVTNFAQILSRVFFPTFAILQEDLGYARHVYLKSVRIVAAVVFPALIMLAFLAAPLILGLFGEQWQPTIFPLQIIAVAGISRAISVPGSDLLRGVGAADIPFKINILETLLISGGLILVASRGIEIVALTTATILSLSSWVTTVAACWRLEIEAWKLGYALVPGGVLAASGTGTVLLLRMMGVGLLPNTLELVVLVIAPGTAMIICLATICREFLDEMFTMVSSRRNRGVA